MQSERILDPKRNWTAMVETLVYGVYDGDLDAFARECGVCRRSVYLWITGKRPGLRARWKILHLYVQKFSGSQEQAAGAQKQPPSEPPVGPSSS